MRSFFFLWTDDGFLRHENHPAKQTNMKLLPPVAPDKAREAVVAPPPPWEELMQTMTRPPCRRTRTTWPAAWQPPVSARLSADGVVKSSSSSSDGAASVAPGVLPPRILPPASTHHLVEIGSISKPSARPLRVTATATPTSSSPSTSHTRRWKPSCLASSRAPLQQRRPS